MDIAFASNKLRDTLNELKACSKAYGQLARPILARLQEIDVAVSISDLMNSRPLAKCHSLTGDRSGLFAVKIDKNNRLVFRPNHDPLPYKPEGSVDLALITSVVIESVEDYH